jgi:Uma2 family endonuclease
MPAIPTNSPLIPTDLRRLEDEAGVEYANGQIIEKPVSIQSCEITTRIVATLFHAANRSGVAQVLGSSMGYKCYSDDPLKIRKPDVSLVQSDRLNEIDPNSTFLHIPADLAVEVIPSGHLTHEIEEKTREYLHHGFNTVWVVYVQTQTLMVHRADGSVTKLRDSDTITLSPLLPNFSCKVADFFGPRPQPA